MNWLVVWEAYYEAGLKVWERENPRPIEEGGIGDRIHRKEEREVGMRERNCKDEEHSHGSSSTRVGNFHIQSVPVTANAELYYARSFPSLTLSYDLLGPLPSLCYQPWLLYAAIYMRPSPNSIFDLSPSLDLSETSGINATQLFKAVVASTILQYTSTAIFMPWEVGKMLLQVQ